MFKKHDVCPVLSLTPFKIQASKYIWTTTLAFQGLTSPYLSDNCQLVTDVGRRHRRSYDVYTCVVPRTQSQIGDRSFSVARPRLWNNLLTETRRRYTTFERYRRLFHYSQGVFVRLGCGAL